MGSSAGELPSIFASDVYCTLVFASPFDVSDLVAIVLKVCWVGYCIQLK